MTRGSFVGLITAVALLFLVCLPSVAAPTEITLWNNWGGAVQKTLAAQVDQFNKENTLGIHVNLVLISGAQSLLEQKLKVAVAAGEGPDLATMGVMLFEDFVRKGLVLPFNQFGKENDILLDTSDLYPGLRSVVERNGKIYGTPWQLDTHVMLINDDMWSAAGLPGTGPANWDELVKYGRRLTVMNNENRVTQWGLYFGNAWQQVVWLRQGGADVFNEDETEVVLDSPEARSALEFMVESMGDFAVPADGSGRVVDGGAAMEMASLPDLKNAHAAGVPARAAEVPQGKVCSAGLGTFQWVLFSSPKAEAAYEFLKWYNSPEVLSDFAIKTSSLAPRRSATQDPRYQAYVREHQEVQVASLQASYAQTMPRYKWFEVRPILENWWGQAFRRAISPTEAVAQAAHELAVLIDEPN